MDEMMPAMAPEVAPDTASMAAPVSEFKTPEMAEAAPPATKALVKRLVADVKRWKKHHEQSFKNMRKWTKFAANLKNEQWDGDPEKYVANITHRHIQQKVASLYAKNPRVRAKRKERMDFVVWDGSQESLQAAINTHQMMLAAEQAAAMGVPPPMPGAGPMPPGPPTGAPPDQGAPPMGHNGGPPMAPPAPMMDPMMAAMIVQEVTDAKVRRLMLDRVGQTSEILYHYFLDEMEPRFKAQAKQWVRRTITTGVGWAKMGYQRLYDDYANSARESRIADLRNQIAGIEAAMDDMAKNEGGDCGPESEKAARLKLQMEALTKQQEVILREGLTWSFPKSWDVIPDDQCTQLVGIVGGRGMAEEHQDSPEEIKKRFKVDLGTLFTNYKRMGDSSVKPAKADAAEKLCTWWEVYNADDGLRYCVLDGYPDFLCEPGKPDVDIEPFFPYFPLVFNEVENEECGIYPISDVGLLWHIQKEFNRSKEALRQHRVAAQPSHVYNAGAIQDEDDIHNLKTRAPHQWIPLRGLPPEADINKIVQSTPVSKIDPALYENQGTFEDSLRVVGSQEANLGGMSNGTATEASIGESSRITAVSSNIDDLDGVLSDMARHGSQVMFRNVSKQFAKKIAGPGAQWPEMSADDIVSELYLDVVAGSSGKPNRAQEAANFERIMPILVQIPGVNPSWLGRKAVQLMDEAVDIDEALMEGVPSILSMNAMTKAATAAPAPGGEPTGNPQTDPGSQGGQGANNQPMGMQQSGGPQPGYPAPVGLTSGV